VLPSSEINGRESPIDIRSNPNGSSHNVNSVQETTGNMIAMVQQERQLRHTFPWSQRKLMLPPPVILTKPGRPVPISPSPLPFPRYGHALPATATATGELFLFGGLVRDNVCNDLYLFSSRDLSATMLQTAGEIPSPRVLHASALVGSVLIVWGGDTMSHNKAKAGETQDDGLYMLNLGMSISVLI
jgi:hypothetical protein